MSDPSNYHTIPHEALNGQTLPQLKDLKRCLEDRIAAKNKAQSQEAELAKEIAKEVKAEGPVTIQVALESKLMLIRDFRPYQLRHQKPEDHPEVQAFIERIRKSIGDKLTKERLEAHGLAEDSRQEVEDLILEELRYSR